MAMYGLSGVRFISKISCCCFVASLPIAAFLLADCDSGAPPHYKSPQSAEYRIASSATFIKPTMSRWWVYARLTPVVFTLSFLWNTVVGLRGCHTALKLLFLFSSRDPLFLSTETSVLSGFILHLLWCEIHQGRPGHSNPVRCFPVCQLNVLIVAMATTFPQSYNCAGTFTPNYGRSQVS